MESEKCATEKAWLPTSGFKKKKNWMVLIKVSAPFRTGSLDMLSLIISFHIKSLELSLHLQKRDIFWCTLKAALTGPCVFIHKTWAIRKRGMSPVTTSDRLFLLDSILVCVKSEPKHQTPTFHNAFSEHICFKLTKYQCFYFRGNVDTSKPRSLTVSVTPFHKHLHLTENSCQDQKTLQLFESRSR